MEKRILTSKEWKEIQAMQEQAKTKRQAEEKAREEKKKAKRKNMIKNAIITVAIYAIITGLLLWASSYIQAL